MCHTNENRKHKPDKHRSKGLVEYDPILHVSPCPVNDLCSRLHANGFAGAWEFVRDDLHVVRLNPCDLPVDNLPFLGVDDVVVQHLVHLRGVTACGISVKDDVVALHVFLGQRQPLDLTYSSRTRCSNLRGRRIQSLQNQGFGPSSLD